MTFDGEEMQTHGDGLHGTIIARLQQEATKSRTLEESLWALARISPIEVVDLLLAHKEAISGSVGQQELARLVNLALSESLAHGKSRANQNLLNFLDAFRAIVSTDTAVAIIAATPNRQNNAVVSGVVGTLLKRDPRHGSLLKLAGELAIAAGEYAVADELLTRLTQVDDSMSTVNGVFKSREGLPSLDGHRVRVAMASSFTLDVLVPYADAEFRRLGLLPQFYVTPFNSWFLEIASDPSGLRQFDPEIMFLALAIDDFVPELAGSFSSSLVQDKGQRLVDRIIDVAQRFRSWSDAPLVVHGLYSVHRSLVGSHDSLARWLNGLNLRLATELPQVSRTYFLDMQELLLHRKAGTHDNPKLRHLASIRLGDRVLSEVARAYARYVAPLKGLRKKCVVLDLDNTLWGGIVGEDGPGRIKLGNASPGVEYQDFQRYLLSLTERGILLTINSKNNFDDAMQVIRSHDGMILREKHFSAIRINWTAKADNMVSIARELNIGVDSFIFVDDNPSEREMMRSVLPTVLTVELPTDPSLYRETLEMLPQLQALVVTDEDRSRVEQYRAKQQREEVRASAQSMEEYLQSLGIAVEIALASNSTIQRIHQLFQRTNQFNLTTRRYDEAQFVRFIKDPGVRIYALQARDRFGDHGLVAAALVRTGNEQWLIDSFLMSCRVIGYGVETALLAHIWGQAKEARVKVLLGDYIETPKNVPAKEFYSRHGFTVDGQKVDEKLVRYRLSTEGSVLVPQWIKMEVSDAAGRSSR